VLLIRRIRELLYEQGFTINGARNRLDSHGRVNGDDGDEAEIGAQSAAQVAVDVEQLRKEILQVIDLLGG
jgi:DNA-binding transcriptional MerR regulator